MLQQVVQYKEHFLYQFLYLCMHIYILKTLVEQMNEFLLSQNRSLHQTCAGFPTTNLEGCD